MFTAKIVAFAAVLGVASVKAANTALCGAHGITLKAENGQSPCEIASLMVGKGAMPEDSPFPELSEVGLERYQIPTIDEADDLRCNPVFYSLVAGCAACQSSSTTWSTWESWTSHCRSSSGVGYIASVMPYDTPIPNWAFTDPIATGGTFNATIAREISDNIWAVPDTIFNVKSESTDSASSSTTCSGSSVNAGAIAGGVVGGVAAVVLGALALFFLRKKSRKTNGSTGSIHSQDTQDTMIREKARVQQTA